MGREQSSIGSSIYYGPRTVDQGVGSVIGNTSAVEIAKYEFDYNNLPTADANDEVVLTIPAGAVIKSCDVNVTTAVTGATDYTVGGSEADGSNPDVDGFLAIGDSALTAGISSGTGAYIGTELQYDTQLTFTFTGTATAGVFEIRVEYYVL